jgi:tRNA nucleotidyltransferase/poly(A) polymerase
LETKVSYERIGKEMDLMFTGKFPFHAMKLLYEFRIVQTVLKFPESCKGMSVLNYLFLELQDQPRVNQLIFQSLKLT